MSVEKVVYVVDDDLAVRRALTRSLGKRGYQVETFEDGDAFLERCHPAPASCLVMDVRMPGLSGLEVQEIVAREHPSLPIIFITGHGDIPMSVKAIKRGAVEFLEKPYPVEALIERIEDAITLGVERHQREQAKQDINARFSLLTERERDVMRLLVAGAADASNKIIARQLDISHRTVDDHRARIMAKMQARSLPELVDLAKVCGIYQP